VQERNQCRIRVLVRIRFIVGAVDSVPKAIQSTMHIEVKDESMERQEIDAPNGEETLDAAALKRLLVDRFSCRAFLNTPVQYGVLRRLFELSQLSASWCNAQPWQLIVTQGAATERFRHALYTFATSSGYGISAEARTSEARTPDIPLPGEYSGVYRERRREAGWRLYESLGIERGDRAGSSRQALKNFQLFGAPHVVIVTSTKKLGTYGAIDTGGWIANFMLVARSFGIASIAQGAIAVYGNFIHEHFGISEDRDVVCGISFGYADVNHPANSFRTDRAALAEFATFVSE
jgi:nitroreductase